MFGQNRSLYNQLNILKKLKGGGPIRVVLENGDDPALEGGELRLTDAELESIKDFVDPRKLKAKRLTRSKHDGVTTSDGRPLADPGFLTALQKILKSYEQPR